jgi:CheY-like chemotaxis protein
VEVATDSVSGGEAVLRFTISDTGIGIPHDKQWQIFGAFVQADASTTRRFGGTGLGLTISANLVEMMGGRIWLTSAPGQGSRFRFVVRFGIVGGVPDPLRHAPVPGASAPAPAIRPLRVLLADDNRTNQRLVELLLEKNRHQVTTVGSGREAVHKAAESPFDLILMDVQMPGMDGFEATAAIRARERAIGGRTPIVAMTAHAMAGDREQCLAVGMNAYLAKPIRPDDLAATISELFPPEAPVRTQPPAGAIAEAALLADFGQNGQVLAEVIDVFLDDARKYLDIIREADRSGDAGATAAAVHALKGSSGLFSASVYAAVRELEQALRSGDRTAADARSQDVEIAVTQLCAELGALRRKLGSR